MYKTCRTYIKDHVTRISKNRKDNVAYETVGITMKINQLLINADCKGEYEYVNGNNRIIRGLGERTV